MEELTCSSCKKRISNVTGTAQFKCPNCGKGDIVRCDHCRKIAAKYSCAHCNFMGPN